MEKKCLELGVEFDGWQQGAGRIILAKRADGKYAATVGGTAISIPRQVGKTFLVMSIVFALCLLYPGMTVIWTAHRLATAAETFAKMQGFAARARIRPHIRRVFLGSGDEEVRFRNGSRILFGARERGFGRGFDEVDVLIFDEAQILTENAIDDMVPATNQSRHPAGALLLYIGTPPKPSDPGEVFTRMRQDALSGEDEDTAYVEFSADRGAALDDWSQVAKANPSYPLRTPREAVLRMRKKLSPESYVREGLGIWDQVRPVRESVIPAAVWDGLVAAGPGGDVAPDALAVDRWHDGTTSIAAAWLVGEDYEDVPRVHVELVAVDVVDDTTGVVLWLVERAGRRVPVLLAGGSPAAALEAGLKAGRVKVTVVSRPDYASACVAFHADAVEGRLSHAGQEQLGDAVAGAKRKTTGLEGSWVWDRKSPAADISGLVAASLARAGAVRAVRGMTRRPSGDSGKVLILT